MSTTALQYENHLDTSEARWFAVYARYKREKVVAQRLQEKGIECYLPLQRLTRYYTRKVKQVELPLISGYLPRQRRVKPRQRAGVPHTIGRRHFRL